MGSSLIGINPVGGLVDVFFLFFIILLGFFIIATHVCAGFLLRIVTIFVLFVVSIGCSVASESWVAADGGLAGGLGLLVGFGVAVGRFALGAAGVGAFLFAGIGISDDLIMAEIDLVGDFLLRAEVQEIVGSCSYCSHYSQDNHYVERGEDFSFCHLLGLGNVDL